MYKIRIISVTKQINAIFFFRKPSAQWIFIDGTLDKVFFGSYFLSLIKHFEDSVHFRSLSVKF